MIKVLKTLKDFALACRAYEAKYDAETVQDLIYNLFEYDITLMLQEEIYKLAGKKSSEPVREALNKLGYMFGVKSLIAY